MLWQNFEEVELGEEEVEVSFGVEAPLEAGEDGDGFFFVEGVFKAIDEVLENAMESVGDLEF